MRFLWGLLSLQLLLLGGCADLTTYQTARVESEGSSTQIATLGYGRGNPYFEYLFRYGLGYHLDWGLKYTFPGPLSGNLKYQFYDTERWAMATSLGAAGGYYFGAIEGLDLTWQSRTQVGFVAFPISYIASYDIVVKRWLAYASLKYFPMFFRGKDYRATTHNFCFSQGFKVTTAGKGIFLEWTYFRSMTDSTDGMIVGFAFFY